MLSNFDIYAQAGGYTAVDKVFNNITPSGGAITIQFTGTSSADTNSVVEAIQVIPQPAACSNPGTFGNNAAGTGGYNLANQVDCARYPLAQDMLVTSMQVYMDIGTYGNGVVGIYTDNAGAPGTLLGISQEQSIKPGWNYFTFPAVNLIAGNYWLSGSFTGNAVFDYSAGCCGSGMCWINYAYNGSLPASISGQTNYGWVMSIYANGCVQPTPTLTVTAANTATRAWTYTYTSTDTRTMTPANTASQTFTMSATATPSATVSSTGTFTPVNTAALTAAPSRTATFTTTNTDTPTHTATAAPTDMPSVTTTKTATPFDSVTPTQMNTATTTLVNTFSPTRTFTAAKSATATTTATRTLTNTPSNTATAVVTSTPTEVFTLTGTAMNTNTPARTATVTKTFTLTATATGTDTPQPAETVTLTLDATPTPAVTLTTTSGQLEIKNLLVYPNPNMDIDNSGIKIRFVLSRNAEKVIFKLFTVAFRSVRYAEFTSAEVRGSLTAGNNEVAIDGRVFKGLSQGMYYYIMSVEDGQGTRVNSVLKPLIIIR